MDPKKPIFDIPMGGENWRELMGLNGRPWEQKHLTSKQATSLLREAAEANNPEAIKRILELIKEQKTLNTFPKWTLGDGSETEKIKMTRAGWVRNKSNNRWYHPEKLKKNYRSRSNIPKTIEDFMVTDNDLAEMRGKQQSVAHNKRNIWGKVTDAAKGFLKTPLGKISLATGKLAGAASAPLWLAGELEPDAEFGFDKEFLGLSTWFPKTRWNEETKKLEKY